MSKIGVSRPFKLGTQNTIFSRRLHNVMANLTACSFLMKHDVENRVSALESTRGLRHSLKISWTLVHKQLKIGQSFYPLSAISALYTSLPGFAHTSQQTELNQTLSSGRKYTALTMCRSKVGVVPLQKLRATKILHLFGFWQLRDVIGEYRPNETRHRQSGKVIGKNKGLPTSSQNFVNFGLQTA